MEILISLPVSKQLHCVACDVVLGEHCSFWNCRVSADLGSPGRSESKSKRDPGVFVLDSDW